MSDTKKNASGDEKPRTKLVPKDNKLQVGARRGPGHYVFISKIFFRNFEEIELHAIGAAISNQAQAAEILQREKLATITDIVHNQWVPEDEEEDDDRPKRTLVKMIISMKRTSDFFDLVEPLDD